MLWPAMWCAILLLPLCLHIQQAASSISMIPENYRKLVEARCFNKTLYREPFILGQSRPVGLSLDYLVSLIETIEEKLPQMTAKEMVIILQRR